jgi:hypothetical protein
LDILVRCSYKLIKSEKLFFFAKIDNLKNQILIQNEREQNGGNGEEPKLHGRYHVYDLRSRTREENMSRFGAPYMGLEPEVPADQVDKIEWSLTRIEFSNKDDARTVRRLLNGKLVHKKKLMK